MTDKATNDTDTDGGADAALKAMSFEQALGELEQIVQDLERGQLDLDAAIKAYERGTLLKTHCDGKLKEAQLRVDKITVGMDGAVKSEPAGLD